MRDGHTFAIVDAFVTGQPFSGNPAGVLVLDYFPDDAWLQGVALELQQAETAYVVPRDDGVVRLRWFTPTTEVALCGHATLASAHWLWESGTLAPEGSVDFTTKGGPLRARRVGELVELDFPAVPAREVPKPPDLTAALGGAEPVWVGATEHEEASERNLLVVLESAEAVRGLEPDLRAISALPAGGLIVTAREAAAGPAAVVSRYFAPAIGIPEDHVTGSAHCTVGPYWRDQLGDTLSAVQASPRGGHLTAVTTDDGRVRLTGRARTAVTGLVVGGA